MKIGLLLLALGFGYKIFNEASGNAKKSIRQLGRIIGIYIMIVSFIGSLCALQWVIAANKANCPLTGGWKGMKMCPFGGMGTEAKAPAQK